MEGNRVVTLKQHGTGVAKPMDKIRGELRCQRWRKSKTRAS